MRYDSWEVFFLEFFFDFHHCFSFFAGLLLILVLAKWIWPKNMGRLSTASCAVVVLNGLECFLRILFGLSRSRSAGLSNSHVRFKHFAPTLRMALEVCFEAYSEGPNHRPILWASVHRLEAVKANAPPKKAPVALLVRWLSCDTFGLGLNLLWGWLFLRSWIT